MRRRWQYFVYNLRHQVGTSGKLATGAFGNLCGRGQGTHRGLPGSPGVGNSSVTVNGVVPGDIRYEYL